MPDQPPIPVPRPVSIPIIPHPDHAEPIPDPASLTRERARIDAIEDVPGWEAMGRYVGGRGAGPAGADGGPGLPIWRDRLAFDFDVSEDSPVVKGTWVTANHVVNLIVDGWLWADILRTHPEIEEDDIRACLVYAVAEEDGRDQS